MLSVRKIQAVSILAKKVFPNDEEFRVALAGYGVESRKDLTEKQASRFIAQMNVVLGNNGIPEKGYRKPGYVGKGSRGSQVRLTAAQGERIGVLKGLLNWSDSGMLSFVQKQVKRATGVEMLRSYEARKVIIGMQRVFAGNVGVEYGVLNRLSNVELKQYQVSSIK